MPGDPGKVWKGLPLGGEAEHGRLNRLGWEGSGRRWGRGSNGMRQSGEGGVRSETVSTDPGKLP